MSQISAHRWLSRAVAAFHSSHSPLVALVCLFASRPQRVPARVSITPVEGKVLRAGMSAVVAVDTKPAG